MLQDSMIQDWPIALCSHQNINEFGATCGADYKCVVEHLVKSKAVSGIGRPQFIQNNENSTFDILLKGIGLVELVEIVECHSYALVKAKKLSIQNDLLEEQKFKLNRIKLALKACLEQRISCSSKIESMLQSANTDSALIHLAAACLVQTPQTQYRILKSLQLGEKLEIILDDLAKQTLPTKKSVQN